MKKLLLITALLLSLAPSVFAAREGIDAFQATDFTAVTTGPTLTVKSSGLTWHKISWSTSGTITTCQIQVDSSIDGSSWVAGGLIATTLCTAAGNGFAYSALPIETNFVRVNVTTLTGGGTVTATYTGYINPPFAGAGAGPIAAVVPAVAYYMGGVGGGGLLTGIAVGTQSININMSTATTTQVAPLTAGQVIRITHIDFQSAGTTNVSVVYGTGANCVTGTTTIAGPYTLTAGGFISIGNGLGQALLLPAGQALCITNSAAIQIGGVATLSKY